MWVGRGGWGAGCGWGGVLVLSGVSGCYVCWLLHAWMLHAQTPVPPHPPTLHPSPPPHPQVTLLFASKGDVHHFDSSSLGPHTALLGLRAPDLHVFRRPKAERGRRTGRESRADANGAPQISNDFDDGFERATSGAGGGGSRPATGRGVSQAASLQRSQSRALRGISQRGECWCVCVGVGVMV